MTVTIHRQHESADPVREGPVRLSCAIPVVHLLLSAAMPGPAAAADWTVDAARSTLGFAFVETGNEARGRFDRWTAQVRFDPSDPAAARIVVRVDMASATTRDTRRDPLMLSEDWLAAARVPEAVFVADGARALGDGRFEAEGTLRLRDGERPVTLAFTLRTDGAAARATGEAVLVRTQYGIGQGRWGGLNVVAPEVRVLFDIVARAAN
jgi:polyisoprenoid-binding protein YceI